MTQAPETPITEAIISDFAKIVGTEYVLSHKVDLAVYECDAETLDVARPDLVVLPASTEEVAEVVRLANKHKLPFAARGAGTGLSGGATTTSGGVSIVLTRMNKVLEVDAVDRLALVQVGVTNSSVSESGKEYGLYFAPDPSSQIASTIGGNIAENAGGPHTLKYGMTTNHVLGLKVVLPDGQIVKIGGRARDRQGLDLVGVFVGSEGTLGIACEAYLKLIPIPKAVETMLAYFPSVEAAGRSVSAIIASGVVPAAMELIDKLTLNAVEDSLHMGLNRDAEALLIVELDGPLTQIHAHRELIDQCLSKNSVLSIKWAESAAERAKIWKARKSSFGALGRIAPHGYVLDGVIPRSKLAEAIAKIAKIGAAHNLTIANVYHAGDGNLHPCMLYHKDDLDEVKRVMKAGREILELCVELGGTLSGEHGIGVEKLLEMPLVFSEKDLEAMGWVRDSFDTTGLCNPGKVLPTPKSCGESGKRPLLRHKLLAGC